MPTEALPPRGHYIATKLKELALVKPLNGQVGRILSWIMLLVSGVFLGMAGLLGNSVLDALAASRLADEAFATRLGIMETSIAVIEDTRFTKVDGLELELRLTERIANAVERIEGIND